MTPSINPTFECDMGQTLSSGCTEDLNRFNFCLDLSIETSTDAGVNPRAVVQDAAARWEAVLNEGPPTATWTQAQLNALPQQCSCRLNVGDPIDDIYVCVYKEYIDGPGGVAGIGGTISSRTFPGTTIVGFIKIDSADLPTMEEDVLNDVMTHELGHSLGT